jgi:poly-beta-1,6-N-acetyl-D-glucosamine synthase
MIYFWSILFFLLIIYSCLLFSFYVSWYKLRSYYTADNPVPNKLMISVIIALRNESKNLDTLIGALKDQSLAKSNFEAFLVNDHSTDNTYSKLKTISDQFPWLHVYELNENKTGKKEALQLGIKKASGELITFTDGDCLPGVDWLSSLSEFYIAKNKPDLIIGLVDMIATTWIEKLLRIEFLSLVISSASAANIGFPVFCNGANLAVKKSMLQNYLPDSTIASGDDVFLLHHIKKLKGNIQVLKSPDHLIKTKSPKSFGQFLEQRRRWASKSRHYTDVATIMLAMLIFIVNTFLGISGFVAIIDDRYKLLLLSFSIKVFADILLLQKGSDIFKYKYQLLWVPLISIFYPYYISLTAILSIKKPFTWKGRKHLN